MPTCLPALPISNHALNSYYIRRCSRVPPSLRVPLRQRQTSLTRDFDDVPGDDALGADLLHAGLVRAHDLAHLGLVLLQGLDGGLGIALLWEEREVLRV